MSFFYRTEFVASGGIIPNYNHTDVLGYRSGFPALPEKEKVMGLERGPLSLVSSTEELLDRKVAVPV
jgi:hypothetical protein